VAARLLARRPLTAGELEARLVAMGYQARTASEVVARARELRWLDDDLLAHDRARALRARGAGPLRIAADLEARGLPSALVAAAIDASREGQEETAWARRALEAAGLVRALSTARSWRLLLQRGFPEDVAARLLGIE
jgi:SOS response regulatory protein OraA/RecX